MWPRLSRTVAHSQAPGVRRSVGLDKYIMPCSHRVVGPEHPLLVPIWVCSLMQAEGSSWPWASGLGMTVSTCVQRGLVYSKKTPWLWRSRHYKQGQFKSADFGLVVPKCHDSVLIRAEGKGAVLTGQSLQPSKAPDLQCTARHFCRRGASCGLLRGPHSAPAVIFGPRGEVPAPSGYYLA